MSEEATMEAFGKDIRHAVRLLSKKPGFLAVATVTLALGIGANTAIFSVVNSVLLRPLSYPDAERLVTMRSNQSLSDLEDVIARNRSFSDVSGVVTQALDFTGGSEPLQVQAGLCTASIPDVLGIKPRLGRWFSAEEDRYGGERTVVLSHGFWQAHMGGDPSVIGKSMPLSGESYTIVGVTGPDFASPREKPDLWVALRVANPLAARFRGVHFLRTYCRLAPGVTLAQAQSDMAGIDSYLEQTYPDENRGRHTILIPLHERIVGQTRPALLILFGAVALVLLIACANFANLLLARASSRHQEMVIRTALGATRRRLIRHMLIESVVIALMGGALGLMLTSWGIDLLISLKPANLPRLSEISIDRSVLGFSIGLSVVTGLVFGLLPAWSASRANISDVLKQAGRMPGQSTRTRTRNILVISELALAVVLLIGAGLLIRGFWQLHSVDPGLDPRNVLTMRIELPEARYKEIPPQTRFRLGLLEALNGLPGVQAAMVSEVPLSGEDLFHNFIIDGRPPVLPGEEPELHSRSVAGDYFKTMRIPVVAGRDFTTGDREGTPLVGIINQSMAREYFPNEDPIGARIRWARMEEPVWMTIVGVASDVKHFGLDQPEEPAVYTPYAQSLQPWKRWMSLVVRSNGDQSAIAGMVKKELWKLDKQLPVTQVRTMQDVVASSMSQQRFNLLLLAIFAATALVLASVGIYGVIAYTVSQRTHEIGIRMALGARRVEVLALVLKQGISLTLIGVACGLLGAFAVTRIMSSLLFGVGATDAVTFGGISVLVIAVALLASYIPARRATRVDPMVALRYE
jgi:putative ABC transport system permease protein